VVRFIALVYTHDQGEAPMKQSEDILSNTLIDGKPIHERLSPTHWTLIVCGKERIKFRTNELKICHVHPTHKREDMC